MNLKLAVLTNVLLILFFGCSKPVSETEQSEQPSNEVILFVGTYTEKEAHVDGKAEGIYVYNFDPKTGNLSYKSSSEFVVNPSYLVVHPSKNYLKFSHGNSLPSKFCIFSTSS